jgi:hypothetical protein
MSVLRTLESRIAGLVEGTFSRVFRSEVRPVELAHKLAREMDEHKSPSVSRTYVPNEYRIYLSPRDRERFADYEDALANELGAYLLEHARRERLALLSRPVIEFATDRRLRLGEFGIQTRVVSPEPDPAEEVGEVGPVEQSGHTVIYGAAVAPVAATPPPVEERARAHRAVLLLDGRRLLIGPAGATIGRSRECEIVIDDPNVSRRHAQVRPGDAGGWVFADLGSTNGSSLNGNPVDHPVALHPGDEIEVGTSVITFEVE